MADTICRSSPLPTKTMGGNFGWARNLRSHSMASSRATGIAQQHHIVAGTGKCIGQAAGLQRVVFTNDRLRPARCNVIGEQSPVVGVIVDDEKLELTRVSGSSLPHAARQPQTVRSRGPAAAVGAGSAIRRPTAALRIALRLGPVAALLLKLGKIFGTDITGDVLAGKARGIELADLAHRRDERPRSGHRDPDR